MEHALVRTELRQPAAFAQAFFWYGVSLILFLSGMVVATSPHVYLMWWRHLLARYRRIGSFEVKTWQQLTCDAEVAYRKRMTKWVSDWVAIYFRLVEWGICINSNFSLPRRDYQQSGPFIVVSNHRSIVDIFVVIITLTRMGYIDLRWVIKNEIRLVPAIGRGTYEACCAFISREKVRAGTDLAEIERCAMVANHDDASVAIFPEGTRGEKQSFFYKHVNDPKPRGFACLCDNMPKHKVLMVAIDWGIPRGKAKTIWDIVNMYGANLRVKAWVCDNPGSNGANAFLDEQFRQIDAFIASGA